MVVLEVPAAIALSTEIEGAVIAVKAFDASEIESRKAPAAVIAPHTTGFHDVVQGEDFLEVQATIPVTVQAKENVGVNPVVAGLPEERQELIQANLAIPIHIH